MRGTLATLTQPEKASTGSIRSAITWLCTTSLASVLSWIEGKGVPNGPTDARHDGKSPGNSVRGVRL
jgi:hypothetical protein